MIIGGAPGYYAAPQDANRYYQRRDLHEDYRDIQNDYAQLDRLRADVARDRYNLNEALANGDEWRASAIARDLARDQRALTALERDIARDHRDIRRDQHEIYRDHGYWGAGWR